MKVIVKLNYFVLCDVFSSILCLLWERLLSGRGVSDYKNTLAPHMGVQKSSIPTHIEKLGVHVDVQLFSSSADFLNNRLLPNHPVDELCRGEFAALRLLFALSGFPTELY